MNIDPLRPQCFSSPIFDQGKFTIGIFLDLKKAFETVNHSYLLEKLRHLGIVGTSLDWFKSYLYNRSQFVNFNKTKSDINSLNYSIPQVRT